MDEKTYKLYITQLKELKGAVVIEQEITEEQFAWIVEYLRTSPFHPHYDPNNEPLKK